MLLNTCSVRDIAEQKALDKMENLAGDVRKNRPDVVLGFMGCMAQSRGQELIDQTAGRGPRRRHAEISSHGGLPRRHSRRAARQDCGYRRKSRGAKARFASICSTAAAKDKSVTAFVSIMQGCNQYCTFCIVPYTRGEERSRTHSRHRGRMPRTGRARREGNHVARPDRDELWQA